MNNQSIHAINRKKIIQLLNEIHAYAKQTDLHIADNSLYKICLSLDTLVILAEKVTK